MAIVVVMGLVSQTHETTVSNTHTLESMQFKAGGSSGGTEMTSTFQETEVESKAVLGRLLVG